VGTAIPAGTGVGDHLASERRQSQRRRAIGDGVRWRKEEPWKKNHDTAWEETARGIAKMRATTDGAFLRTMQAGLPSVKKIGKRYVVLLEMSFFSHFSKKHG